MYSPATAAHMLEHLVKLEAKSGPLPDETPVIDEILEYLAEVLAYYSIPSYREFILPISYVALWFKQKQ